jgi:hypothetical protein
MPIKVTYIPQGSVLEAYRYFSCWKHTDIFRVGSIQIFFVLEAYNIEISVAGLHCYRYNNIASHFIQA